MNAVFAHVVVVATRRGDALPFFIHRNADALGVVGADSVYMINTSLAQRTRTVMVRPGLDAREAETMRLWCVMLCV